MNKKLCSYGCNQEAKFQFKNGKWCCCKTCNSCPEFRRKNGILIKNNRKTNKAYEQFGFKGLKKRKSLSREELISILENKILDGKRNIKKIFSKKYYVESNNLVEFLENILYYTNFLKNDVRFVERFYCLYNNIIEYPKCSVCEKTITKFDKNFNKGRYRKFCSSKCNRQTNNPSDFMSQETKNLKSEKLSRNRKGLKLNSIWKNNLKQAANKEEVKEKKKKSCLNRYGVENPGVLGAYSSKAAMEYILGFLNENRICLSRCYFKNPDYNKEEFFQMIYVPFLRKKKYFSYDLVVFKNEESFKLKDINNIELVLEYDGPWHYEEKDIIGHENEPFVPYKNCKYTKKQSYELDKIKISHICKCADNVAIYNWKNKELTFIK